MTHSIRRYIDAIQTLTEAATGVKPTPAQRFVQTIQAGPRCKHCTFEVEGPRTVLLTWIEGGGGLVPYLTQIADQLRVKLTLMVEVYDTSYGGKLVRYYEKNGFETKSSDFEDDFDFMNMPHNDEMQGQVYMERKPAKAQTLGEDAERILYHVTPARNIARIMRDGLIPKIGPRSRKLKEPVAGIYLFHSIVEAEDGAANWLGDEFGDETRLALLAVKVPDDAQSVEGAGFETVLTTAVPPQNITIVSRDF